jgi:hypothetical protein
MPVVTGPSVVGVTVVVVVRLVVVVARLVVVVRFTVVLVGLTVVVVVFSVVVVVTVAVVVVTASVVVVVELLAVEDVGGSVTRVTAAGRVVVGASVEFEEDVLAAPLSSPPRRSTAATTPAHTRRTINAIAPMTSSRRRSNRGSRRVESGNSSAGIGGGPSLG